MRLNRTMLTPNGHKPAPKSVPISVSLSPNAACHSGMISIRSMKAKAVATRATKHALKSIVLWDRLSVVMEWGVLG